MRPLYQMQFNQTGAVARSNVRKKSRRYRRLNAELIKALYPRANGGTFATVPARCHRPSQVC
jgi:hypothetical protein